MNDQLGGILRAVAPFLTSVLIVWGVDSVTAGLIGGAFVAVGAAVWSWFTNTPANKLKSAGVMPEAKAGTVVIDGVPIEWKART